MEPAEAVGWSGSAGLESSSSESSDLFDDTRPGGEVPLDFSDLYNTRWPVFAMASVTGRCTCLTLSGTLTMIESGAVAVVSNQVVIVEASRILPLTSIYGMPRNAMRRTPSNAETVSAKSGIAPGHPPIPITNSSKAHVSEASSLRSSRHRRSVRSYDTDGDRTITARGVTTPIHEPSVHQTSLLALLLRLLIIIFLLSGRYRHRYPSVSTVPGARTSVGRVGVGEHPPRPRCGFRSSNSNL